MSRFKILYTLNHARIAGTEKHLLLLLKHLNKELFEPSVVCFAEGPLIDMLRNQGIPAWPFPRKKLLDYSVARKLYDLMKHNKFDLLHSHCGQFACLIAKLAGVPHTIETRHGLTFNYDQIDKISPVEYFITKTKAKIVNLTLTVSKADEQLLIQKFRISPNRVKNVVNGLDIEDLANYQTNNGQLKDELVVPDNHKVVGTVARFTEQKGLKYFIKAIKNIKAEFPKSYFIIVGDGTKKDELVASAKGEGVYEDILFTGYRDDAISLMSVFDVFVLPSLWEGMPFSLLEAMAMKIPAVATDVFGNRELVVEGKTGLLIEPRNSEAISRAVTTLLKNQQKATAMGEAAFARIEKHFSAKRMTEQIEKTYLELLNGRR